MKISEMTLEQLQDYAVARDEEINGLRSENESLRNERTELTSLNQELQRRNNALFLKVEQQGTGAGAPEPKEEPKVQSCEDFARSLIK